MKKINKILIACIIILLILGIILIVNIQKNQVDKIAGVDEIQSDAYTEITTNSEWDYYVNDDNTTTISLTNYKGNATELTIPSTIDGYAVTTLRFGLFYGNKTITTLTIPENITHIDSGLFTNHTYPDGTQVNYNATEANLTQDGGNSFSGFFGSSVTTINIGNNVKYIPHNLIQNTSVETLVIPSSVTKLDNNVFMSCDNLKSVTFLGNLDNLREGTFMLCENLEQVILPSNLKEIGAMTFWGCKSLGQIDIPNTVTTIGDRAFIECKSLKQINIPNSVTTIENGAFAQSGLTSVEIPTSVTTLGNQAFAFCNDLTRITIPAEVTSIGANAFQQPNENLVIRCETGSVAHQYAEDNRIRYELYGEIPTKTLNSIEIKTEPTKTTYKKGEQLNLAGGQITAKYSDNSTQDINMTTGVTTSGFDSSTVGEKTITVTYQGKTATFKVKVTDMEYHEKEDGSGIVIDKVGEPDEDGRIEIPEEINGKPVTDIGSGAFAGRDDITTVVIPDSIINIADDAFDEGTEITIECNTGSKAEEFAKDHGMNYELIDKTIKGISIHTMPNKVKYAKTDTKLDLTGGRLKLTYTDNTTSPISMKKDGVQMTGFTAGQEGEQTITTTYKQKNTTFKIEVTSEQSKIQKGDVTLDGVVDSTDLLHEKRHIIAGSKTAWILTGDKFKAGDMNDDGKINATDLLALKRKIVGIKK